MAWRQESGAPWTPAAACRARPSRQAPAPRSEPAQVAPAQGQWATHPRPRAPGRPGGPPRARP
eukprot:3882896-Alexandrium_andersonii.AAC.1